MKLSKILLCYVASLLVVVSGCTTKNEETSIVVEPIIPVASPTPTILHTEAPKPVLETKKETTETQKPETTETPAQTMTVLEENINELFCELNVHCKEVWEHIEMLPENKRGVVPDSGIIFSGENIEFQEGESVFDVLQRELGRNKIHFEFVKTLVYNSAYIEGISNLYEFDMGEYSGWMYRVNGEKPNVGSSQYKLTSGDKIEVYYSLNYLNDKK